jgi:protein involved in polysaccharide export with SLBB domain/glycosyltransferase involved in cell wall biosynthesis
VTGSMLLGPRRIYPRSYLSPPHRSSAGVEREGYPYENSNKPVLLILGIRGIPAAHGGFETFAEKLALHMVEQGWEVTVYCQRDGRSAPNAELDVWRGVKRVLIPVPGTGPLSTVRFDLQCIRDAHRHGGLCLVLGYNTACFLPFLVRRVGSVITNMDGIEWKRKKWSLPVKIWFYLNERLACLASTMLIADHPEIYARLITLCNPSKVTMIPYGADRITDADPSYLGRLGLEPNAFVVSIARIEPENSILEMVSSFARYQRSYSMVCLGAFDPARNRYHRRILQAASSQVKFPGPIYDKPTIAALRKHALAYLHGHTVGGTNPSLVEALGAGSAVVAHKNRFNQWTAGPEQFYFETEDECDVIFRQLTEDPKRLEVARTAARRRHMAAFTWGSVLAAYHSLCESLYSRRHAAAVALIIAVVSLWPAARLARAEYLLGPGDKLEVTVANSLTRRAALNVDGQIAMPEIGAIQLAGLSLLAAQLKIRDLYRASGVLENPDVFVEVVEYRPFYIDGDVARPGAYPYQPNLTVRAAIALAGGYQRSGGESPLTAAVQLQREQEILRTDRVRLILRQLAIRAELNGETEIKLDDAQRQDVSPSLLAELTQSERQQLKAREANHNSEIALLNASIKDGHKNLDALTAQLDAEKAGARREEQQLGITRENVTRGVLPQIRIAEGERNLTNAQSRYLATQAQVSTAERSLSDLQRELAKTEGSHRAALMKEAEETTLALEKIGSQLRACEEQLTMLRGVGPGPEPRKDDARITIFRKTNTSEENGVAQLDSDVFASDVVEIRLRVRPAVGITATSDRRKEEQP